MRHTACTTVAAGLVLGGALAGCGADTAARSGASLPSYPGASATPTTAPLNPQHIVQAAYTKTSAAGSMRFAMNLSINASGLDMHISGAGVETLDGKQADVSMTVPGAGDMQLRLVDRAVYVKASSTTGPAAGKWLQVPAAQAQQVTDSEGFDPKQGLKMLQSVSTDGVHDRGPATVRGVPTTHYVATLDMQKVAAQASSAAGATSDSGSDSLGSMLTQSGLANMPVDLYIDDQGRLRRLSMTMDMSKALSGMLSGTDASSAADPGAVASAAPDPGALSALTGGNVSMSLSLSMDCFGFGVPVHLVAPSADQVTTDADALKSLLDS